MPLFTAPKPKKDDPFEKYVNGAEFCQHERLDKSYTRRGYSGTCYCIYTCADCGKEVDRVETSCV